MTTPADRTRSPDHDAYVLACELAATLASTLVIEDVLESIARRIAEALGVWECDLYEYYSDSETIVATSTWSPEPTQEDVAWVGTKVPLSDRPGYAPVFAGGQITEAYFDDEDADAADLELMAIWGEKATLAVPLAFEGEIIGCLTLIEKRGPRRFADEDKRLAGLLAIPAAIAIHNARQYRRQEQQNRQLASLLDASRALTSTVVLEDVLALVCRKAGEALATGECVIYEYDPLRDAIIFRAIYEAVPAGMMDDTIGTVYPLDEYPSDRELLESGAIKIESISDAGLASDVRESMLKFDERTCLNIPLTLEGEPVGILVLIQSDRERRFTDAELELAEGLGEQAAVAIRHARLYRRQERQNQRLLALLETSRVLAASLDANEVAAALRAEAAHLFAISEQAVGVYLPAEDDRFYPMGAAPGGESEDGEGDGRESIELDPLAAATLAGGRPQQTVEDGTSRLVVPLGLERAADGFVDVRVPFGKAFTDDEVGLLQILSSQAGAAIVSTRLYRTIERQAITDGLTGLYNHRHFYERLVQEFARAQRYELPLSLLMIDVDDFKLFNDRFGHPVGDLVLGEVGGVLRTQLRRDVDFAARYGGEEFVVLLPNTPRDGAEAVGNRLVREFARLAARGDADLPPLQTAGARTVGERIRRSIADTDLPGIDDGVHVTVSVGVAAFPGSACSPDELVTNADKALYLAKRLGKNRIEVYGA